MFVLEPERTCLDVSAGQVLRLLRSSNPVQVGLSGFPGQRAGSFLCVIRDSVALDVFVALELLESRRLVFFRGEVRGAPVQNVDELVEEGLAFVEAMGFLMADLEIEGLSRPQREEFWALLPLSTGKVAGATGLRVGVATGGSLLRQDAVGKSSQIPPLREDIEVRRRRLLDNLGRILAAF